MFLAIKFAGGLGNQLFQYATCRSLCIRNKIPFLYFDTSLYDNDYLGRKFGIQYFNIKGQVLKSKFAVKVFMKNTRVNNLFCFLSIYKNISEENFLLHNLSGKTSVLTSVSGYWQSPAYFENIRSILLKELVPLKCPAFPHWIDEANTVAIGVRRTDYLVDTKYGFIGTRYYEDAFEVIVKKIKDPLFIIFSDDIEWCKENFKNRRIIFFEESNWSKDYLKVFLMSKCKHQIISNSSFYWWGAWLNTNPHKVVIRPSRPFNDMSLLYESHYPPEWIAI